MAQITGNSELAKFVMATLRDAHDCRVAGYITRTNDGGSLRIYLAVELRPRHIGDRTCTAVELGARLMAYAVDPDDDDQLESELEAALGESMIELDGGKTWTTVLIPVDGDVKREPGLFPPEAALGKGEHAVPGSEKYAEDDCADCGDKGKQHVKGQYECTAPGCKCKMFLPF